MYWVAIRVDAGYGFIDWNLRVRPCCGTRDSYEWVSTADGVFTFNHYWGCFKKKTQLLSRISAEFHPKPLCLWYYILLAVVIHLRHWFNVRCLTSAVSIVLLYLDKGKCCHCKAETFCRSLPVSVYTWSLCPLSLGGTVLTLPCRHSNITSQPVSAHVTKP